MYTKLVNNSKSGLGRKAKLLTRVLLYGFLMLAGISMVVPFVIMLITSLRPNYQLTNFTLYAFLSNLNWSNRQRARSAE